MHETVAVAHVERKPRLAVHAGLVDAMAPGRETLPEMREIEHVSLKWSSLAAGAATCVSLAFGVSSPIRYNNDVMPGLKWSTSHAVFVTEIDDEHKEIFEVLSEVEAVLKGDGAGQLRQETGRLMTRIAEHFAHEERLMRAARYGSLRWHKQLHDAARKRVAAFARQIKSGKAGAAAEMVEYLNSWLHDHTRVADRMMGAALRNHRRCMWKVTFCAGTKPLDAGPWVTADGEPFDPPTPRKPSE